MSDLISRQDAIEILSERAESLIGVYGDLGGACRGAMRIIESLPSEEPERRWIPVSEALPEEDKEVLVTVRFDGTKNVKSSTYVETASQIGGSWTSYSDEWKVSRNRHHVIAWMPLPRPAIIGDVK